MRALLVPLRLKAIPAIDLFGVPVAGLGVAFLGQVGGGGTYLGRVGRVGQVGQVGRRDSASEGCHSASPRSRLAEPKTGGLRGTPYLSTLVVAQAHVSATARVDYYIADSFPAGRSGAFAPSDAGSRLVFGLRP